MKQFFSIMGNSQKLDGGAMFGNAPKALWQRWIEPDDLNRIDLACRCLLIKEGNRNILFEAGIGTFFPPKLQKRFGVVEAEHMLCVNLKKVGLAPSDIDIVVLSHLHFDHAGGLLAPYKPDASPELIFPNARFIVSQKAFERACHPHKRDSASFIPELPMLLQKSKELIVTQADHHPLLGRDYRFHYSDGHTPGLLCTEIKTRCGPVVFGADLIPGVPWVHLPITMGYDRFPECLIDEKETLLKDIHSRQGWIFFTHDYHTAMAKVSRDNRGRYTTEQPLENLTAWPS